MIRPTSDYVPLGTFHFDNPSHARVRVIRSVYYLQNELIENGGGAMPDRESDAKKEPEKRQHGSQVHLKPAGEALVEPQENPPDHPGDKNNHPRCPLPLIPEGLHDHEPEE